MLGSAVDELLDRVPPPGGSAPRSDAVGTFIGDLEARAGSLAVGYDPARSGFTIEASDFLADVPVESIALVASRRQLEEIQDQIETIVAASRPRCVLCGTPLTGEPHFCPQSNGHGELERET